MIVKHNQRILHACSCAVRKTAIHDSLAAILRNAREQAGISQRDLARRLGTNQTAVSFVEGGTQAVRVSELVEWCAALGVDPVDTLRLALDQSQGKR